MTLKEFIVKLKYESEGEDKAEKGISGIADKLKSGVGAAAKTAAAAIGAATTAVSALASQSIQAYADYEQLVGGVETLFGAQGMSLEEYAQSVGKSTDSVKSEYNELINAQNLVMENASKAYETAGLSANDYMETVTSFAASLKQSVETETEAAEVADMAVTDMADNANKMGTSMESIQNAYNGFAKQNYTMLDNLKLGYGGTKDEMERLLADAEKISGVKYDINNLSDVYNAIHTIQGELGITGTTAKEASETISGSMSSMKSAWENLLVGLSDENADLGSLVDNVIDKAFTVLENILPRIETALPNVATSIKKALDTLIPKITDMIQDVLPTLIDSAMLLITGVVDALPDILSMITEALPQILDVLLQNIDPILDVIFELLEIAGQFIVDNASTIISAIVTLVAKIAEHTAEFLPVLLSLVAELVFELTKPLMEGLSRIAEDVKNWIIEKWQSIKTWASEKFTAIGEWFSNIGTTIKEKLAEISENGIGYYLGVAVAKVANFFVDIFNKTTDFFKSIPEKWEAFKETIKEKWETFKENAQNGIENFKETIKEKAQAILDSISEKIETLKTWFSELPEKIKNFFTELPQSLKTIGSNIIEGLKNGVSEKWEELKEKVKGFKDDFIKGFKDTFGIHSPSTVFAEIGNYLIEGLWNGINDKVEWIKQKLVGFKDSVMNALKDFFGIHSPSKLFRDEIGKNLALGIGVGFENTMPNVESEMLNSIPKDFNFSTSVATSKGAFSNEYEASKENYEIVKELLELFKTGKAKTSSDISNARELRRVINA